MGGSPKVISTPAPVDNSLELERLQQQERAAATAAQEQKQAVATQTTAQLAAQRREEARVRAQQTGLQAFRDAGVDTPDDYGTYINASIDNQLASINDSDTNPGQYFTNDWANSIVSGRQTALNNKYTRSVDQAFGPNYATSLYGDASDDDVINSILGAQRSDAVKALDAAKARGNLDDIGYSRALGKLGEQETAGRATANTLGGNVRSTYQSGIKSLIDTAKTDASKAGFGGFDLSNYAQQIAGKQQQYDSSLSGDITNALSGQKFFDIGDILSAGGTAQGAVNPTPSDAAIIAQRAAQKQQTRGLGGQGVF